MNNSELSKICAVSQSFVASVRSPEAKQKQDEAKKRHIVKKAEEFSGEASQTSQTSEGPDEDELKAHDIAMQADLEAMHKLLESSDALTTAHEEIKKLNYLNGQLEIRLQGLMNEKNEAVKMVKKLQKELDALKVKK
jgi:hypothetical protein